MANYVYLYVNGLKKDKIGAMYQHIERKKKSYPNNKKIDTSRTHLNYHIISPEKRYWEIVQDRLKDIKYPPRYNTFFLVEGVCVPTSSWIEAKSPEEQREFFEYVTEFIREFYGESNMVSAVVHMDETHPHMHFVFTPITDYGKFLKAEVVGTAKNRMRDLQNRFYEHISRKYPDISRGIPKDSSKRERLPIQLFKSAAELAEHYNEIYEAVQNVGLFNNTKQKEEVMELLSRFTPEVARMNQAIQSTNDYIGRLESETAYKDEVIERYRLENEEGKNDIARLKRELGSVKEEKEQLEQLISFLPAEEIRRAEREIGIAVTEGGRER